MKKCLIFVVALVCGVMPTFAAGPGWTVTSKVTKVVVVASGGVNIRLSPELSGCTSQSGYGGKYASIYPDHPGLQAMYALLLTAYTTGKDVTVHLSDNTCKVDEVVLGGAHNSP